MLSRIIKIIVIVILLVALVYAGACAYFNFFAKQDTGGLPKMPNVDKAAYNVHIKNTGNLILTNKYEQLSGQSVGERVFVLHGYWELVERKFVYRKGDIILSELVFGEITIRRR